MTSVPSQMGPFFSIRDADGLAALDAILQKPGAKNLVAELYKRMTGDDNVPEGDHNLSSGLPALDAVLKTQGAENLIGELHRRMRRRLVPNIASLFDARTGGLVFGPKSVIRDLEVAVEYGTAENHTYHFAMTAIAYAMALEELDPNFFKDKKHLPAQGSEAYAAWRQKILDYVSSHLPEPLPNVPRASVVE